MARGWVMHTGGLTGGDRRGLCGGRRRGSDGNDSRDAVKERRYERWSVGEQGTGIKRWRESTTVGCERDDDRSVPERGARCVSKGEGGNKSNKERGFVLGRAQMGRGGRKRTKRRRVLAVEWVEVGRGGEGRGEGGGGE